MDDSTKELTAEELKDQQERANAFIADYGELVKKHEMDFASFPVLIPDGEGAFKMIVQTRPQDVRGVATKSPFVA